MFDDREVAYLSKLHLSEVQIEKARIQMEVKERDRIFAGWKHLLAAIMLTFNN
jgi:hypothetical protein